MKNGYFIDHKKEYVITNHYPKRPLMNYLWNETTLVDIDQFGFGPSAIFDENRTRRNLYYVGDNRLIYIMNNDDKTYYAANRNYNKLPFPKWETHVGQGYSLFSSSYNGLDVDYTIFVPTEGYAECWEINLKNTADKTKDLSVYTMAHLTSNSSNHKSYAITDFDDQFGGILGTSKGYDLETDFTECYMASDYPVESYEIATDKFIGYYNSAANPVALENGGVLSSSASCFENDQTYTLCHKIVLNPGEEKTIRLIVGIAKSKEMAIEEKSRLLSKKSFDENRTELLKRVNQYDDQVTICTGDETIDRFVNIWLKRQIDLGKTWARCDVVGSRDTMQDVTAFVQLDTEISKEKIIYAMGFVRPNGNIMRSFIPIMRHVAHDCSSWMITAVCQYIKESGDYAILDIDCPYFECDEHGTVLDHLMRAAYFLLDTLGEHGLTLWGACDWNDSLNNCGRKMRGESVWLSQASCKCTLEFAELLERINMSDKAKDILVKRASLMENILRYGWEKDHFIYGFNDNGDKIGSYESIDGNNYLNPQTWAVLSEMLSNDKLNTLMDYVEDTLQCDFGYVQVDPPHIHHNDNIGRVTYFAPGCYENGSVYNHGCTFKIAADCMLGRGDEALKTVNYILPTNPLNPSEKSGMEPYAISNQYLGPKAPARVGESPMHWITGTCGWLFRGIVEYMLGVQADYDGLRIVPAMPKVWKNASVHRIYRGCTYDITYTQNAYNGKVLITVDGNAIEGNLLPYFTDGIAHKVDVQIG